MDENILKYQERIGITIDVLVEEIRQVVNTVVKNSTIYFRVKDPETLRQKMQIEKAQDVFSIDDVYGTRIVVESVEEAYAVLAKVSQVFTGYIDHDYFKKIKPVPSVDGKVLRLIQFIAYRNGVGFEIQITTVLCHEVNEPLHQRYHNRKYHS